MDDRGRTARPLRGLVMAGLSTLLIAVGHVLAGGPVPDLAVLLVLFPLLTAAVVGLAERCRSTAGTLATLAGGQYALHLLLGLLHPHPMPHAAPGPWVMLAFHASATLVVAVLLRNADRAVDAAGAALRRVLRRRPFLPPADGPLRPLRIAGPAEQMRRLALAAVPTRRGPPVEC
jgi:hypothetical protein